MNSTTKTRNRPPPPRSMPNTPLTPAQKRILPLVLRGLSTNQIAETVGRSPFTVQNQIKTLLQKYNVRSRTMMVATVLSRRNKGLKANRHVHICKDCGDRFIT